MHRKIPDHSGQESHWTDFCIFGQFEARLRRPSIEVFINVRNMSFSSSRRELLLWYAHRSELTQSLSHEHADEITHARARPHIHTHIHARTHAHTCTQQVRTHAHTHTAQTREKEIRVWRRRVIHALSRRIFARAAESQAKMTGAVS